MLLNLLLNLFTLKNKINERFTRELLTPTRADESSLESLS